MTVPYPEALRPGIFAVLNDIIIRHNEGSLSDLRGRAALSAFITSHAPEGFLNDKDLECLDVYLDISLQLIKRSGPSSDEVVHRVGIMTDIAMGKPEALRVIRSLAA